jgi:hypothetical protein
VIYLLKNRLRALIQKTLSCVEVDPQMRRFSILVLLLLAACGGGDGGSFVIGDQRTRTDYLGMDLADMNGDGLIDVVAASVATDSSGGSDGSISIFLQNAGAPGTFTVPEHYPYGPIDVMPMEIAVTDLQMSGLPDVIGISLAEGGFRTLLQEEANPGALLPSVHYGPQSDRDAGVWPMLTTVDIDGDLMHDVLIAGEGTLVVYPQDGAALGSFLDETPIGNGTQNLAAGDVNDDGLNDALTFAETDGVPDTLLYYRHNLLSPGQFLTPMSLPIGFSGHAVSLADINGDTRADIVISGFEAIGNGNFNGRFTIFLQTAMDTFQRLQIHTTSSNLYANRHAVTDLEGDGVPEIILGQRTAANDPNTIEIFSRGAGAIYESEVVLTIPDDQAVRRPEIFSIKVADLNSDMQPDIAVSTYEIFVFFQQQGQPGTFGSATRIAAQR